MKKCPYCAEEIQEEAIKCRYCMEWLNKTEKDIARSSRISNSIVQETNDSYYQNQFNCEQIDIINNCVAMAEELVSNFYKISENQWVATCLYDIKTIVDLSPEEIVHGPFAQVIRYKGWQKKSSLGSSTYNFYRICLQDHSILSVLEELPNIKLFPFMLYTIIQMLVLVVRFSIFDKNFEASRDEMMIETAHSHETTYDILKSLNVFGIEDVLKFYEKWRKYS